MNENPSEDQSRNPPGLQVALTEAITENDEDMMALEEAAHQDGRSTELVGHDADDDTIEGDPTTADIRLRAMMLEEQLHRARAEVQKLTRPITLEDALPVMEAYQQLVRIVCPLSDSEREKWEASRERCLKLQKRFQEKGERCRSAREQCEELRAECEGIRARCIYFSQYYDKFQEKVNSLFEEDEEEDDEESQELYDMMRGRMGQREQEVEGFLKQAAEILQMIEDMFLWVVKLERKSEYNIHQLRRFEGILDDILRSFDYWFGGL
ncbi:uncharacterized protein TRIVIDRAFT_201973 [Trichoderma virens Gv29-8]|uniref:Uncharacterized protein n=1 Tax=Hypocrea virens (strain Gv29-8 / FGSC 10586) TaxID=413071 RepID=G9MVR5_HYPVG|nr:uncharacterized protein TRIVIDRAFT_201973 [Trichoderma virens Gv29-8]EHK21390.1 hypothetical protein TRIVIDRAFT_201973 [Trichoderma virens Gv29-8]UKZ53347.1 hypothetical protein TrVGV298_007139 [Trichoderma virens]